MARGAVSGPSASRVLCELLLPAAAASPAGTRALTRATARPITNRTVARIAKMPSSFRSRASSCSKAILAVLRRAHFGSALICWWCRCCVTLYASDRGEARQILHRNTSADHKPHTAPNRSLSRALTDADELMAEQQMMVNAIFGAVGTAIQ